MSIFYFYVKKYWQYFLTKICLFLKWLFFGGAVYTSNEITCIIWWNWVSGGPPHSPKGEVPSLLPHSTPRVSAASSHTGARWLEDSSVGSLTSPTNRKQPEKATTEQREEKLKNSPLTEDTAPLTQVKNAIKRVQNIRKQKKQYKNIKENSWQ